MRKQMPPHRENPNLYWEAGTAFLQGRIISYVVTHKKTTQKKYQEASERVWVAQTRLNEQHTPDNLKLWHVANWLFDVWAENLENIKSSHIELQFHKHGNKARRKLLARLSKGSYHPTHITSLKNTEGTYSTSPKNINKILELYSNSTQTNL